MDIKQEQDILSMLVDINKIEDNSQEVVSFYGRIITKEQFTTEAKVLVESGYKNENLSDTASTELTSRLIQANVAINENMVLTANIVKASLKNKLIELYKSQGFTNKDFNETIENSLAVAKQEADIEFLLSILKSNLQINPAKEKNNSQPQYNSANYSTAKTYSNPIEKPLLLLQTENKLEEISILLQGINHNFSEDIKQELAKLENKSVDYIKQNLKLVDQRKDLLSDDHRAVLGVYIYLSSENKNKVNIFNFHKHVCEFINLGLPKLQAYNRSIELIKLARDKNHYQELIAQTADQINRIENIIEQDYSALSDGQKSYITQNNFKCNFYALFAKGYDLPEILEIIANITKNSICIEEFDHAVENYINKSEVKPNYQVTNDLTYNPDKNYNNLQNLPQEPLTIDGIDLDVFTRNLSPVPNTNFYVEPANISNFIDPTNNNISYSTIINFGGTCWLNSAIKFIYTHYGINRINQIIMQNRAANNYANDPVIKNVYDNFLGKTAYLFNSLANHQPIGREMNDFLESFCQYAHLLEQKNIKNDDISLIFNFIRNAVDMDNGKASINLAKINQQDAEAFIESFINILKLNADNNTLVKKSFRRMIFTKKDLATINANIVKNTLEIKVEQPTIVKGIYRPLETKDTAFESNNFNQENFRDYLARGINTANLNQDKIQEIIHNSLDYQGNDKITSACRIEEEFFADTTKLSSFMLDINHATVIDNELIKDIAKNNTELTKIYPLIQLTVTDINTNKNYNVEAKADTMVCHTGLGGDFVAGHYTTITNDDNDNIIMHDDNSIRKIEDAYRIFEQDEAKINAFDQLNNLDKILEYAKISGGYPKNIGFKVLSIKESK